MLKIRLQRIGRTNDPSYRVVVTEHQRGPKAGKPVDTVGSYNPKTKQRVLDAERIKHWLSVGAQASGTMHNMLISANVITGKKVNVLPKKTVPLAPTAVEEKKEDAAAAAPAEAAPTAAPDEAPPVAEVAEAEAPKDEVADAPKEATEALAAEVSSDK